MPTSENRKNRGRASDERGRYPQRFKPGTSGNPGGRPKGAGTLIYNVRDLFARAIKNEEVETEAIKRLEESLKNRRSILPTLELAARLNREIGLGSEDVMPGVTIIFQSNLKPGSLKKKSA